MTEMSLQQFGRAAIQLFGQASSGFYGEGLTLRLLEDIGVSIVRGDEGAVCDASILPRRLEREKTLLGTLPTNRGFTPSPIRFPRYQRSLVRDNDCFAY
jgi:hypothetical protein